MNLDEAELFLGIAIKLVDCETELKYLLKQPARLSCFCHAFLAYKAPYNKKGKTESKAIEALNQQLTPRIQPYKLEVRAGIEPACRSFADSGLTTWLPHRHKL